MAFHPRDPHISVAVVMTGAFQQFADPLDWIAQRFDLNVKVDRSALAESLSFQKGGPGRAAAPFAEALGSDKKTRFEIQVIGKCEGKMVAQCRASFNPLKQTLKELEDPAIATTALNDQIVLGVQATAGEKYHYLDALELPNSQSFMRVMPLNVFNRAFFTDHIDYIEDDPKLKAIDIGHAVLATLVKPWLFYDMPMPGKQKKSEGLFLPFSPK